VKDGSRSDVKRAGETPAVRKEREAILAKQVEPARFRLGAQARLLVLLTYYDLAAFHYEFYLL
jgi:hypothetical protein